MIIRNRTGNWISLRMFHGNDEALMASCSHGAVDKDKDIDLNAWWPTRRMIVYFDHYSDAALGSKDFAGNLGIGDNTPHDTSHPFSNSNTILIRRQGKTTKAHFVDWTSVGNKYQGMNIAGTPGDASMGEGVKLAAGIITSLATGVAALGPAGAVPSGALMLSTLLLS